MKVTVLQENLARGLNIVSRAVAPRSTLPVLGNILIATDEGRLRLSATNLELGITCWIGAKIDEDGSTTVPARTFTDLVSTLSDKQVSMSLNVRTQSLSVHSGASNTDMKCIDAQEFPVLPPLDISQGIKLNVVDMKEMIQQVAFAASDDQARPVLTGVFVSINGNKITLAAADGYRLSVRKAFLSEAAPRPISAIIPARAMTELARISSEGEQTMTMIVPPDRGQVAFRLRDIELVSQFIDGTFPDYENLIPTRGSTRVVISTSSFLKAVRQAEIFAREGSHIARISVKSGESELPGVVEITGESEETGHNQTAVDANIEGPDQVIAFNVRYLREVMDVIKTPNFALETTSETRPGLIRPVGEQPADGEFIHVIMPMHLGS